MLQCDWWSTGTFKRRISAGEYCANECCAGTERTVRIETALRRISERTESIASGAGWNQWEWRFYPDGTWDIREVGKRTEWTDWSFADAVGERKRGWGCPDETVWGSPSLTGRPGSAENFYCRKYFPYRWGNHQIWKRAGRTCRKSWRCIWGNSAKRKWNRRTQENDWRFKRTVYRDWWRD